MSARPGRKAGPEGVRGEESRLRLIIRLTEAEREAFDRAAVAAGMGVGPWLRRIGRLVTGMEK